MGGSQRVLLKKWLITKPLILELNNLTQFFTLNSFFLWITHFFIHSIIHSITRWKYSFNKFIHSKKSEIIHSMKYSFNSKSGLSPTPMQWWVCFFAFWFFLWTSAHFSQNHWRTTDVNGDSQAIGKMAMVPI